ncbi:MAG: hypothetical protein GX567_12845 [Clostridia bacterium]|nr:hypothetical protein [Clostridia bacterium]
MNVNGVSGYTDAYSAYTNTNKQAKETPATAATQTTEETGVVYEPSDKTTAKAETTAQTYKPNAELVAKLKADVANRTSELESIVRKMLSKQGQVYGEANDIWSFLAKGEFTVSPEVKAQAQADIAEDGYWGVEQTSDRILDMAKALTGGDPDKIEEMRSAFEKGFKQATKAWGKDLPDISSQTYDAVMKKFDSWAEETSQTSI